LRYTAGATDDRRFLVAAQATEASELPVTLSLKSADGTLRTETVDPQPLEVWSAASHRLYARPSGLLGDLDASDLFYLNMDHLTTPNDAAFDAALAAANQSHAAGLIVDMRGYPGSFDHAAQGLIPQPFLSPIFSTRIYAGPDAVSADSQQFP